MANEFRHGTVGAALSQAEWESITGHAFDAQVTGDIPYASSATQISRLAIGATGTVLQVAAGLPSWVTPALTRAGGNSTEATTTSTTAVDLLTASSLSITAATPFDFWVVYRKTTGAAANFGGGLKLNATVTEEASVGGYGICFGDTANAAQNGLNVTHIGPRVGSYLNPGWGQFRTAGVAASGTSPVDTTAPPTATITDVVIRAISGNAAVTVGMDELQVYSYSVS